MSGQIDFDAEVIRLGMPLSMKSAQACEAMDVGPTKLRELISAGKIDGRKRGRDLVVMTASILRYNANLPHAEFTFRPKRTKDVSTAPPIDHMARAIATARRIQQGDVR